MGYYNSTVGADWIWKGRFPVIISTAVEYLQEPWKARVCEPLGTLLYLSDWACSRHGKDSERFSEILAPDCVRFSSSENHNAWIEAAYDALTKTEWLPPVASASWN